MCSAVLFILPYSWWLFCRLLNGVRPYRGNLFRKSYLLLTDELLHAPREHGSGKPYSMEPGGAPLSSCQRD